MNYYILDQNHWNFELLYYRLDEELFWAMNLFYPSSNNSEPLGTLINTGYNFTPEVTKVVKFYPLMNVMLTRKM